MRVGTKGTTGPWRITLQVRDEPRCPGCAEFLQPIVVEFRDGWGWCAVCVGRQLHAQQHIAFIMRSEDMWKCSTIINGLRFYTPDPDDGPVLTAYEWYEKRVAIGDESGSSSSSIPDLPTVKWEPDGVYALAPSGELELADLDVSELAETEATLKRVRSLNSGR